MPNGIYTPGQSNAYVGLGPNRRGMINQFGWPETEQVPIRAKRGLNRKSQFGGAGEVWNISQPGPRPKRRKGMRNRPGSQTMSLRQLNQRRAKRTRHGLRPLV